MKITREALKRIVIQEMARMEESETETLEQPGINSMGDEDEMEGMGEISEGEGMDLMQQVAQTLFDSGITAVESPEQAAQLLKGLGKAALLPLAAAALGAAGVSLTDAIGFLKTKNKSSDEMPPQGRDNY
tara:strand:+ start:2192 stop:2581 length:390 start_codon:yes stop_codon:yes gene_type:complete